MSLVKISDHRLLCTSECFAVHLLGIKVKYYSENEEGTYTVYDTYVTSWRSF